MGAAPGVTPGVAYGGDKASLEAEKARLEARLEDLSQNGTWVDELGPRNGPPMNYWRQAMDERLHRTAMRAIDAAPEGCVSRQLKPKILARVLME